MFTQHVQNMMMLGEKSLAAKVASILRKYGTDAHVYLPGIGTINGLTAGNYLESAGTTAATVDNPVGLVLDAAGSVSATELFTNGDFSNGLTGWTSQNINAGVATFPNVTSGTLRVSRDGSNNQGRAYRSFATVIGKTYKFTINASVISGANGYQFLKSDDVTVYANLVTFTNANTGVFTATATTSYIICAAGVSTTASFDNISVKEVTGIHALQATTANKPILRSSSNKYSWQFDGSNDSLALGSVPFQMADDHCVIAGVKRNDDGIGDKTVFSIRSTAAANPVIAALDISTGAARAVWRDDAGTLVLLNGSALTLGVNYVLSIRRNSGVARLYENSVQKATSSTALGATTPTSASIGVSPVATPTSYFKGDMYPVIAIKGTVTDADRNILEKFVGTLSGVIL